MGMTSDDRSVVADDPDHGTTAHSIERAARNNALWCDAVCAAHGASGEFHEAFWLHRRGTPRHYPDLVTLSDEPVVQHDAVAALIETPRLGGWSVKDSFASLDLGPLGFSMLFDAEWIGLAVPDEAGTVAADGLEWRSVAGPAELVAWEAAWVDAPLESSIFAGRMAPDADIRFLLASRDGVPAGGGILNRGAGLVGVSNVFVTAGETDRVWCGLANQAAVAFPGLPLVGYEHGGDLATALRAGFTSLGALRVWYRP